MVVNVQGIRARLSTPAAGPSQRSSRPLWQPLLSLSAGPRSLVPLRFKAPCLHLHLRALPAGSSLALGCPRARWQAGMPDSRIGGHPWVLLQLLLPSVSSWPSFGALAHHHCKVGTGIKNLCPG